MVFLIFLGLLPSFIWLSFFLQEDIHPEPRRMIFLVFLGGMAAAIIAVTMQYFFQQYLDGNGISRDGFYPVAGFAVVEEIFKFIFTYALLRRSKYFNEPVDAMIYMVTAASGMAAVENVAVMLTQEATPEKVGILVFRFLGATLLHILSSAVVGYYWAKGILRQREAVYVMLGLAIATLIHAVFNYFIIVLNGGVLYSILFLIIAAFFVFYDFEKLKKSDKIIEN